MPAAGWPTVGTRVSVRRLRASAPAGAEAMARCQRVAISGLCSRDAVRRTADAGGLVGGGAVRTAASEETRSRREPETKHHA